MTTEHTCHAKDCKTEVPPKMFMCLRHWKMVPRPIQRIIWEEYSPGQEITKTPSMRYLEIARDAIAIVHRLETQGSLKGRHIT